MEIRKATYNDVEGIVNVHIDAFQGFFLTSLGPQFLKFYYSCFIKSPETATVCIEENGKIIGFAASAIDSKGFNSRLIKKNFIHFGKIAFELLLTSPKSLFRLLKNMRKSNDKKVDEEYAELYSIGVYSREQGKGLGRKLLFYSEQVMKEMGVARVSLTTDYYNNESSIGFYRSMGYNILYIFTTYPNRKMYRMIKIL